MLRRPLLLAALAAALLGAGAAVAEAAPFLSYAVTARTAQGSFQGRMDVARFLVEEQVLLVQGRLSGLTADRRYPSTQRVDRSIAKLPLVVSGSCTRLTLTLPTALTDVGGIYGHTRTVRRRIAPRSAAQRKLFCATAKAVKKQAFTAVAAHLNALRGF
jgi:hypothetical protein